MAVPSTHEGDHVYSGSVIITGSFTPPDSFLTDAKVSSSAAIDASKLKHRHAIQYSQADGSDVVSETKLVHLCRKAGVPVSVQVRPTTKPTGGDKQYTVDVQKASDGSGSWTSILSSVVTLSSGSGADDTITAATLVGSPTVAASDALRVVITASGSTGSQGQGVVVTINLDEDPN